MSTSETGLSVGGTPEKRPLSGAALKVMLNPKQKGLLLLHIKVAPVLAIGAPILTPVLAIGAPILTPLHPGSLGLGF